MSNISKKPNFLSSSCYNIANPLSLKHKRRKKHAEHADLWITSGTHLSLLSVLLCSSPRFAKIFCLFCYRSLKWLCLRDLASKVMNTKGKAMRKIQPAGDTVHVSFVRTQALSVEWRPLLIYPSSAPIWSLQSVLPEQTNFPLPLPWWYKRHWRARGLNQSIK